MYIAVDIGGTKTLVVLFDNERKIIEKVKFATPKDVDEFFAELSKARDELNIGSAPVFGAIGTKGNVDRDKGLFVVESSTIPWHNVPLVEKCRGIFGCDFVIENDSKLAGLAEAHEVTDTYRKVVYITVSTGIGTAFVVDGVLDQNTIDSEVGKMVFEIDGTIQTWENFASGKAITEKYNKRASDIDATETAIWDDIAKNIALGLISVVATFQPEVVIFGGGVSSHFAKFEQPLRDHFLAMKSDQITTPDFVMAKHSEEAVVYGGYLLCKQQEN